MYVILMKAYPGLTIPIIADMNPVQQYILCRGEKTVTFNTNEEYERWLASRNMR